MMRVITGSARGIRLKTPKGENTRPTSERIKEAMFSAIQFELDGRRVLDLYAGSGQLGIEALSRGASSAVFAETEAEALGCIRDNLEAAGFADKARVLRGDALELLSRFQSGSASDIIGRRGERGFGLVFLDPPYASEECIPAIQLLGKGNTVVPGGILVCETAGSAELPETAGNLTVWRTYHYGKLTKVTIYRRGE